MNPNRNDEAFFRPNISENEEEGRLPERRRWKTDRKQWLEVQKAREVRFFKKCLRVRAF